MVQEMLLSENAAMAMSPARISFSYDLPCQSDASVPPPDRHLSRSPSSANSDFDFCVRKSSDQDSSPADELFSDGKILATEIKKRPPPKTHKYSKSPPPLPPAASLDDAAGAEETEASKKQITETSMDETEEKQSKSFWRFKRSSSLNCGSGYGPSLCPLPLLSRSNSTGSATSVKRTPLSKDTNHNAKHKPHSTSSSMNYQKPPLKKSYGSQGNGVRVNPVLNVPAVNIFGLASIFSSSGRDKNKNIKK